MVIWVNAATRNQTLNELARIARGAELTTEQDPGVAATALVTWINQGPGVDRLIVFDNVHDADDLNGPIPRAKRLRVLITTTSRTTALGTPVEVGLYTLNQAANYLIEATRLDDRASAEAVAKQLGRLPVAITQAATAISLLGYNYPQYLQALNRHVLDHVVRREPGDPYPDRVGAALRIAYKAVLHKLECAGPVAARAGRQILDSLSLLAETGVPREWLHPDNDDELAAREALGELVRISIVVESEDRHSLSLHRLMARVIREDNTPDRGEEAAATALATLERAKLDAAPYALRRRTVSELSAHCRDSQPALLGQVARPARDWGLGLADYLQRQSGC